LSVRKRRGYLLAPRRFLTLNTLIDTVLEADGISREVIAAQRERVELISQLAEAYDQGEEELATAVAGVKEKLDYEFFTTLTAFAEASAQTGQVESAQMLAGLRDALLELTGFAVSEETAGAEEWDIAEVVRRLVEAPEDELDAVIGELRPAIDYSFFEELAAQIDEAEQAGDTALAASLGARRTLILETVERMDKEAQALFEAGAALLSEVMAAEDAREALRARAADLNEAFFLVLETNVGAAERAGRADIVERMRAIGQIAAEVIEESLTPEERLINQLLQAEADADATRLLRQNLQLVNTPFVKRLNELADDMDKGGRKPIADRLRQLAREAGAMLF